MSIVFVETNTGDVLRATIRGRPLEIFFTGLLVYFDEKGDEELKKDFTLLESDPSKPLADYCKPLLECFYAGDWNYTEDEYTFFLHRTNYKDIPEEVFKTTVRAVKELWRDIDKVMRGISLLLSGLMSLPTIEVYWFARGATIEELQELYVTCQLAQSREAEQVKIKFDI